MNNAVKIGLALTAVAVVGYVGYRRFSGTRHILRTPEPEDYHTAIES